MSDNEQTTTCCTETIVDILGDYFHIDTWTEQELDELSIEITQSVIAEYRRQQAENDRVEISVEDLIAIARYGYGGADQDVCERIQAVIADAQEQS
jgi:hypothetical protein